MNDFIATARAYRRHTERMFLALIQGKRIDGIRARKDRLYRLYQKQVKQDA